MIQYIHQFPYFIMLVGNCIQLGIQIFQFPVKISSHHINTFFGGRGGGGETWIRNCSIQFCTNRTKTPNGCGTVHTLCRDRFDHAGLGSRNNGPKNGQQNDDHGRKTHFSSGWIPHFGNLLWRHFK